MIAITLRRTLVGGLLGCVMPCASIFAQAGAPQLGRTVLVTPLLHAGPLSDSLARLVRLELARQYQLPLVRNGDVSASLQRSDSAGQAWTFESVRALASAHHADGLVDVAAVLVADGLQITVASGRAPFAVIDNTRIVTQASLPEVAQDVARQLTRRGWPANEH